jgi:hypothetical protein
VHCKIANDRKGRRCGDMIPIPGRQPNDGRQTGGYVTCPRICRASGHRTGKRLFPFYAVNAERSQGQENRNPSRRSKPYPTPPAGCQCLLSFRMSQFARPGHSGISSLRDSTRKPPETLHVKLATRSEIDLGRKKPDGPGKA